MPPHPYGILSLLPPVVAIGLAIVTRRAAVSLVVGIYFGALVTTGGDPFTALYNTLEVQLWPTLTDEGKLRVFSFTLLMGAMIGVVCRSGGMRGLIELIAPLAKSRRSGQLMTWFLGLLIFFDDYANTILLGNTLRPLCNRLRISREKLAYLVDSTAAPVAGLALVSTWVAVEIDYLRDGLEMLPAGTPLKAFDLFLASIPYRFYVLMSLLFVPLVALLGRDYGPMLAAERRSLGTPLLGEGNLAGEGNLEKDAEGQLEDSMNADSGQPARWFNGVLPILVTLAVVMVLLIVTGKRALVAAGAPSDPALRDILGAAASSFSLFYGSLAGLTVAALLARSQGILTLGQIISAAGLGARVVLPAIAILWCASSLSRMTGNKSVAGEPTQSAYQFQDHRLYTGDYLAELIVPNGSPNLQQAPVGEKEPDPSATQASISNSDFANPTGSTNSARIPVELLPTVVFLLAAVVSFCTGTSYGTMGILLPMVISLTYTMLTSSFQGASSVQGVTGDLVVGPDNPILLACVGGVLAGAIFGDHCSPISDTTILSSQACACDHMAHVVTQMPYALTVAVVAVLFGTLPLGWGVSVWYLLPMQAVVLIVFLRIVGRKP
jgi:Na+/H+ antiporter NhaC